MTPTKYALSLREERQEGSVWMATTPAPVQKRPAKATQPTTATIEQVASVYVAQLSNVIDRIERLERQRGSRR